MLSIHPLSSSDRCRANWVCLCLVLLLITGSLSAANATINLDQTNLTFSGFEGGANPPGQTVNITNTGPGGSTLNWIASATKPWFSVAPFGAAITTGTSALTITAKPFQAEAWNGTLSITGPAPTDLRGHTAVWTGSEMIVWGGYHGVTYQKSGARYNPLTNTWSAIADASIQRSWHVAVWTGQDMIVWGGSDGNTFRNDGERFHLATNTWSPISSTNAPVSRFQSVAVWTGNDMLIWGGENQLGTFLNTGKFYSPSTDTWNGSTSLVSAPTPRIFPCFAYTGTEMIIWGGENQSGTWLGDGARYTVASDTWAPISNVNAPVSRSEAAAAWTGTEFIIWGGVHLSGTTVITQDTGARYNPATNTWVGATTNAGAPSPRVEHTAVWTGSEMLLWGGTVLGTATGARYQPPIYLTAGTYPGTITVCDPAATNNPQTINVSLTVTPPPPPTIQVTPTTLNFTAAAGGNRAPVQSVNINNIGPAGSTLAWNATCDQPWLTYSPQLGVTSTATGTLAIQPVHSQPEAWNSSLSTTGAPTACTGATAVWTGTDVIVWGGFNGSFLNSGTRYNPTTNTWTAISLINAPGGRYYHAAVWTGTEMYIWGGYNGVPLPDGARYNPTTDTWLIGLSNDNSPSARYGHSMIWTGSQIIVWGGKNGSLTLNDGKSYNPVTDSWSAGPTATGAPTARSFHSAVWTGREMLVWGGNIGSVTNTGGRYNPVTNTWNTAIATLNAPAARSGHIAVWTGNEMIIWGGDNSLGTAYFQSGARFNPATNTWTGATTSANAPSGRSGHCAAWIGDRLMMWGGWTGASYSNAGAFYLPPSVLLAGNYAATITLTDPLATNNPRTITVNLTVSAPSIQLTQVNLAFTAPPGGPNPVAQTVDLANTGPVPTALNWRAAANQPWLTVTPTLGTTTTGTDTLSIQALATQSEAWAATTSLVSAPSPRSQHCAVWTGTEMIIWGGTGGAPGGIYDPATNTWRAISNVGAPVSRMAATAVWTGTEMIIWGGSSPGSYHNNGYLYNLATDSWSGPTSTINAPEGRYGHCAVWTGTEMVVWGGEGIASTAVGGRYNRSTNTWLPVTTVGQPELRSRCSAVWTGSEMLMWGGENSVHWLNTGARYNPVSDTWTGALATVGAPSLRSGHTAVWTGSEMIVWGGEVNANTWYNNGAHFNPATNTWTAATPTAAAPTARDSHSAVWTGKEMIVWGGYIGAGVFVNDGAFLQLGFNLPTGLYSGSILVTDSYADNNPQKIIVSLYVSNLANLAPTIASPAAASPNPVNEQNFTTVSVSAGDPDSGPSALTYTWYKVSGPGAVSFSPNTTSAANVATATFTATGTYTLGVAVSDGAGITTDTIAGLSVTLNPILPASSSLSFSGTVGATTPVAQTLTITNSSGSSVTVTLSEALAWLSENYLGGAPTVTIPAGSAATFNILADPTGLNGTYSGTLTITNSPSGGTQTIPVTFTVSVPPAAGGGGKKSGCGFDQGANNAGLWLALGGILAALSLWQRRDKRSGHLVSTKRSYAQYGNL